jgi:GNAT superfamily N-acetyltransferase
LRVEHSPGDDSRYLAALNQCFDGWGGQPEFGWYFERPFEGRIADRFVLADDEEWIAGSAVTWRRVKGAQGSHPVGIMTGSWTLPAARGKGCFARIIELSLERCAERGAAWLLAFVTEENKSRSVLEKAGSTMVPTAYIWSEEGASAEGRAALLREAEADSGLVDALWRRHEALRGSGLHFAYDSAEAWRAQFIDRTNPTLILTHDSLGSVVVERHGAFDRVIASLPNEASDRLALERAVIDRTIAAGRRFFTFTSDSNHSAALRALPGIGGVGGFLTILPVGEPVPAGGDWLIESGDRV